MPKKTPKNLTNNKLPSDEEEEKVPNVGNESIEDETPLEDNRSDYIEDFYDERDISHQLENENELAGNPPLEDDDGENLDMDYSQT